MTGLGPTGAYRVRSREDRRVTTRWRPSKAAALWKAVEAPLLIALVNYGFSCGSFRNHSRELEQALVQNRR
jgi:hypothetical protein